METIRFAAKLLLELVPLFVLISTVVYLVVEGLTPARIERFLGGRRAIIAVPLATLLGAVTPFCSCSTVPLANGMLRAGVPVSSLSAFLLASPMVSPVAIALLWSSLGAGYALLYSGAAMGLAAVGGVVIGAREKVPARAGRESDSCTGATCSGEPVEIDSVHRSPGARLASAFSRSLAGLRKLAVPLLAGPGNLLAVPLAAVLAVPVYASIVVVLPLGMSLLAKGVGLGAVTAFLMAASGFSLPEGIMLSRILHRRLLLKILAVFASGVIGIGYLFELLLT